MENIKILVIRNDNIGDLVLSTPVFREVKKYIPKAEITALVSPIPKPIIEKNKAISKILEICPSKHNLKTLLEYFKTFRLLKKEKFDYGFDLRGSLMNTFFLLYLAGIKNRIGRVDQHPIISRFLTKGIMFDNHSHICEDNLKLINEGLGIKSKNSWPEIIVDKMDINSVNSIIFKNNLQKYICICPIASLAFKQWPLENFKQLIFRLKKEYPNRQIVLLGTSKEKEILEDLSQGNCKIFLNFNIRKLSIFFKKSLLVIVQDSGPMHIAWASGARVLCLLPFDLYKGDKVLPLGNSVILKSSSLEMNSISPNKVLRKIKRSFKII